MILNIVTIAMIALPTFFWATSGKGRGLYSAFLNLVCVLIAGAIGFGLWDTIANALLGAAGSGGLVDSIAWGAGLLIPFVVSLAILRFAVDTLLGANIYFSDTVNLAGGALCGLVAAFITTGVVVTSLQFMGTGRSFLGYSAVTDDRGNLVQDNALWVPADKFTVKFYEYLSLGAFRTETPLALAMPDAHQQGAMSRLVYATTAGTARVGLKPGDFEVLGRYTVEGSGNALFADANDPERLQQIKMPDGSSPPSGSTIEGFAVRLRSGAVEQSGSQVIFGAGQARLILHREGTDDAMGVQAIAIIAPPEGGGMHRFRIDADQLFIPTVGGAAENTFIFEFVVPPNWTPAAIALKNARKDVTNAKAFDRPLAGWAERDDLLASAELLSSLGIQAGGAAGNIDDSGAVVVAVGRTSGGDIRNNSQLPNNFVVQEGDEGGLRIDDGSAIIGGREKFERQTLEKRGGAPNLRRDRFAATGTTGIVQITLATDDGLTEFGGAIESAEPNLAPVLVASSGEQFQPIGYVLVENETVTISFEPNRPIRSVRGLPIQLSRTKRGQDLTLVYRPTKKAEILGFALVDTKGDGNMIVKLSPPLSVDR